MSEPIAPKVPWTDYLNSDPIQDVVEACGDRVGVIVALSREAYRALRGHPDFLDRLRTWLQPRVGPTRPPTGEDLLAMLRFLWDVDAVVVDDALAGVAEIRSSPAVPTVSRLYGVLDDLDRYVRDQARDLESRIAIHLIANRLRVVIDDALTGTAEIREFRA